jgi:hypothetical protein
MNPHLQEILHNITTRLAALEQSQKIKKEAPSKQKLITQKATERALHALELRKKGWTYKAVGIAMNVSASRARDLANKGERILNRRNHESIST